MIKLIPAWPYPRGIDLRFLQKITKVLNNFNFKHKVPSGNINLKFAKTKEIQTLNKLYAGKNVATDILSFSYVGQNITGSKIEDGELGDIIINITMASKQARKYKINTITELSLLTIHGVLHIMGYDHQDIKNRINMEMLQAKLLDIMGIKEVRPLWD